MTGAGEQSGSAPQEGPDSSEFLLQVGPERLCGEIPHHAFVALRHGDYREFVSLAGDDAQADSLVRFFVAENELTGWRDAEAYFGTDVWRLGRTTDRHTFVVGTAFEPPQPYWVAGVGAEMRRFEVARLEVGRDIPVGQVIEAALRILPRLALMQHLLEPPTGMLVHAAGAVIASRMHLFLGQSGAGKTTLSRLLLSDVAGEVVNDDRLLLTRGDDAQGWTAWGTPWPGELRIARNRHAPLGGVFFLEKSERTAIVPLAQREAVERLIPLLSIPWYDPALVAGAFDLCERLVAEVPAHTLRFRPDRGAVDAVLGHVGA